MRHEPPALPRFAVLDLMTGRCVEYTVVGHHGHQRVEIVPVPGIGEAIKQHE
jgi:hypothetical protein